MSWWGSIALAMVFSLGLCSTASRAGEAVAGSKLVVGIKEAPPFVIKNADGSWSGISIDLWQQIAAELNLEYEPREFDLQGLLKGVRERSLDAAVAALTVTPEREEVMDFTHPFHTSGLGIAVPPRKGRWVSVLQRFFSWTFVKVLGGLVLLLLATGMLVWCFERRRNREQFSSNVVKGLGEGLWWSAVTMTTVGYGDKAPKTAAGRAVAMIWMFAGIVIVSGFTAALASVLTTAGLESRVQGPEDLPHVRVATVSGTTSEAYLREHHVRLKLYDTPLAALEAVAAGHTDAAVYDAPMLRYLVAKRQDVGLHVLARKFERQDYSIALPSGSPLRESINQVLLRIITDRRWQDTLYRYMGS